MIRAVAFCPAAPVLVAELAQDAAPELDELRAACRTAIRAVAAPGRSLLLIAADERRGVWDAGARGSLRGLGLALDVSLGVADSGRADPGPSDADRADSGPSELPLSLTVGAWLVHDALGPVSDIAAMSVGSGPGARSFYSEGEHALVVLGDGSARRGVTAPGYLDDRAAGFDTHVEDALRRGDADALAGLDAGLGAQLMAGGVPAWRAVAAALTSTTWDAQLLWAGDPYGVAYFAARWVARD